MAARCTITATATPVSAPPPAPGVPDKSSGNEKGSTTGKASRKRKTTDPPAPRAPNWVIGELKGVLAVAPTHWADYRGSRTSEKSRRTSSEVIDAFVMATPAENRVVARTRTAAALDRKLKDTRTEYVATRRNLRRTGLSASQREDLLIKLGGSELYSLARDAFKTSAVATESTGREPVVFGASTAPGISAVESPADEHGEGAGSNAGTPGRVVGVATPGLAAVASSPPQGAGTASLGGAGAAIFGAMGDAATDGDDSVGASDHENDVPRAVDLLAAAEARKDHKNPKRVRTSAAISAYMPAKNERESAIFDERHSGRASGSGREANVVSDNDIRVAVLDMIGAIAAKARRQ